MIHHRWAGLSPGMGGNLAEADISRDRLQRYLKALDKAMSTVPSEVFAEHTLQKAIKAIVDATEPLLHARRRYLEQLEEEANKAARVAGAVDRHWTAEMVQAMRVRKRAKAMLDKLSASDLTKIMEALKIGQPVAAEDPPAADTDLTVVDETNDTNQEDEE